MERGNQGKGVAMYDSWLVYVGLGEPNNEGCSFVASHHSN
jgi:hypothetical protein